MGNKTAFISWPHGDYDDKLMQEFIRIRNSLKIFPSFDSPLTPLRPARCYIAGETNCRVADRWQRLCQQFVEDNKSYGIKAADVGLKLKENNHYVSHS
jgi:hypothetical protein